MSATSLSQVAAILTEPFAQTGVYASPEQALKHIILDYIERQIAWAEAEIQRNEQKHQQTFYEWTESLLGQPPSPRKTIGWSGKPRLICWKVGDKSRPR